MAKFKNVRSIVTKQNYIHEAIKCKLTAGRPEVTTFCPHSAFMCFVWISEQTAIISLYSINWLVCINETVCVYCAVRTECLNTIQVNQNSAAPAQNYYCLHSDVFMYLHSHFHSTSTRRTSGWSVGTFQQRETLSPYLVTPLLQFYFPILQLHLSYSVSGNNHSFSGSLHHCLIFILVSQCTNSPVTNPILWKLITRCFPSTNRFWRWRRKLLLAFVSVC